MGVSIDILRELVKAERWFDLASLLTTEVEVEEVRYEVALAGYKANTKIGNLEAAEHWLTRALTLTPTNSTLQRDKGVFHQKRQEWLEASMYFENASSLRPEIASYHGSLAYARYQLGNYKGAAESFHTALTIDSENRGWWIRLARSFIHLNSLHEAVDAYDKALALQDDTPIRSARDDLLRQIRSGSSAASSAYYDAVFSDSPKYQQPAANSEYAPIWQKIFEYLRDNKTASILDLGCGPGQFAEFIAERMPAVQFTGLDFSGVAISHARQRCPTFLFERRELPINNFVDLPTFDTVVCTEVLEHVEADLQILAPLPAGIRIVATVPNFDAFGHLRIFRSEDEIRARYGVLIDNLQVYSHRLSNTNLIWLMQGVRSIHGLEAPRVDADLPATDLPGQPVELVLWTDQTRYVQDFLGSFGLPFCTLDQSRQRTEPHVALRHDVDWSIEQALAMAKVEHELGIQSTYYLLHPDGKLNSRNYFGYIEDERLVIAPSLFKVAGYLLDLGHEVGLHNDLLTLALMTRRQPADFLEQIVEAFRFNGLPLTGTVAHGSRICRDLGYMNYQIFKELQRVHVAVDYQDSPDLFEKFMQPTVEYEGHVVRKFDVSMVDYGLNYEANFLPWDLYVSDSSARWSIWQGQQMTRFDKFEPRERVFGLLDGMLREKPTMGAVQCLVHACHWSVVSHHVYSTLPALQRQRNRSFAARRRTSINRQLKSFPNVLLANASERFEDYNQKYSTNLQVYNVPASVDRFMQAVLAGPGRHVTRMLEVGCGQGDFLAATHAAAVTLRPVVDLRGLGVDGSAAAIMACAGRYPHLQWAADGLEHFLEVHDSIAREDDGSPVRYDLVIDKTGAIFIPDHQAACNYFEEVRALMRPGALYVYVASRHYYERTLKQIQYLEWPEHWLQLAERYFEPIMQDDDHAPALRGYYKRAYRLRPDR